MKKVITYLAIVLFVIPFINAEAAVYAGFGYRDSNFGANVYISERGLSGNVIYANYPSYYPSYSYSRSYSYPSYYPVYYPVYYTPCIDYGGPGRYYESPENHPSCSDRVEDYVNRAGRPNQFLTELSKATGAYWYGY